MVGRSGGDTGRDPGPDRDRGQILLIGAVVIAFAIIGIVLVFNTTLYTQSLGSSESVDSVEKAADIDRIIEADLERIAAEEEPTTVSGFTDAIEPYEDTLNERIGDSGPQLVRIEVTGLGSVAEVEVTYVSDDVTHETRELEIDLP